MVEGAEGSIFGRPLAETVDKYGIDVGGLVVPRCDATPIWHVNFLCMCGYMHECIWAMMIITCPRLHTKRTLCVGAE